MQLTPAEAIVKATGKNTATVALRDGTTLYDLTFQSNAGKVFSVMAAARPGGKRNRRILMERNLIGVRLNKVPVQDELPFDSDEAVYTAPEAAAPAPEPVTEAPAPEPAATAPEQPQEAPEDAPAANVPDPIPPAGLRGLRALVYRALSDQQWHTLDSLAESTKSKPDSVSARIRELRHPSNGALNIEKRPVEGTRGFEYRLTIG